GFPALTNAAGRVNSCRETQQRVHPMNQQFDPFPGVSAEFLDRLEALFGERLSVAEAVRERFGKDESYHPAVPPDAVVTVRDTAEVSALVKLAGEYRVPVIPYGAGTSLEGSVSALAGGVAVNLQEMN